MVETNFSAPPPTEAGSPVSLRSIIIACALTPLLSWWVVSSELIWNTGGSTALSLFYHVTVAVFCLALLNLWVQRTWPHAALSPPEILTIYVMLSVSGSLCSHDFLQILFPMIAYPAYAANPQNRWEELVLEHLPEWAIVADQEAIRDLALGNSTLYRSEIFLAWWRPMLFWGFFTLILAAALLLLNSILRKQWTERERLSFPILQIPWTIAGGLKELLKDRLFWIAFGIVAAIDLLNGFHHFFPSLPEIPVIGVFSFSEAFRERPWNAIAGTTLHLYPFAIGLVFFLPADLAFSCWFFYILYKLQLVLASSLGYSDLPGFPFTREQSAGGYLGLGLLALWYSRRHLLGVVRKTLGLKGGADDSMEPLSYRATVFGFVACAAILIWIGQALGASLAAMAFFFSVFFLYALAIARIRAELGPPAHDLYSVGPDVLWTNALGTRGASEGNLAAFSLLYWINRGYRSHFAAHSMEGFKAAQAAKIRSRAMLLAIAIALVVGIASSFWALLHSLYVHGYSGRAAGDAFASESWIRMSGWIDLPHEPRIGATLGTLFGLGFTLLLGAMRGTFAWWVWRPLGYVTSFSWSMERLWACFVVGWACRALITRYGGAKAYRKAVPFFIGLVLGEFVIGSFWSVIGNILGEPVYRFWG